MKKNFLLHFIFVSLISCDKIFKDKSDSQDIEINPREYAAGTEKDENGCLSSAGYTWSALKNDCIRVFEVGYRLNPVQINTNEPVISAFIIFEDSKEKVELFLPNLDKSIILNQEKEGLYENEKYVFDLNEFTVKIDNKIIYEAAKEELLNINDNYENIE